MSLLSVSAASGVVGVGGRLLLGGGLAPVLALRGQVGVLAGPQLEHVEDPPQGPDLLVGRLVAGPRGPCQGLRIGDGSLGLGRNGDRLGRGGRRLLLLVGNEGLDLLATGDRGEAYLDLVLTCLDLVLTCLEPVQALVLGRVFALECRDPVVESLDVRPELGADLGEGLEAIRDLGCRLVGCRLVAGRRSGLQLGQRLLDATEEVERRDIAERLEVGEVRLPRGRVRDGHGVVDRRAEVGEVGGCLDLCRDLDSLLQHGLRRGRGGLLLGGVLSHGDDSPCLRALPIRAVGGE